MRRSKECAEELKKAKRDVRMTQLYFLLGFACLGYSVYGYRCDHQKQAKATLGEFKTAPALTAVYVGDRNKVYFDADGDGRADFSAAVHKGASPSADFLTNKRSGSEWLPLIKANFMKKIK